MALEAKILTVSDSVAHGEAVDRSGEMLAEHLQRAGFVVREQHVVPDGIEVVSGALRDLSDGFCGLLITTGGTGFGPRDVTPEATSQVVERLAPGFSEAMRLVNTKGRLSRGVSGTIGQCLVLNTPGLPEAAIESLDAVLDVIPHALELISGGHPHPHAEHERGHELDHHDHRH